jgi:hypothetical protein
VVQLSALPFYDRVDASSGCASGNGREGARIPERGVACGFSAASRTFCKRITATFQAANLCLDQSAQRKGIGDRKRRFRSGIYPASMLSNFVRKCFTKPLTHSADAHTGRAYGWNKQCGLLAGRGYPGSGSDDGTVKLWRVSDDALLRTLKGHTSYVGRVAFSPDGTHPGLGILGWHYPALGYSSKGLIRPFSNSRLRFQ